MPRGNPKPQYAGLSLKEKKSAYTRAYYERNKEARKAYGRKQAKEYREKNRELVLAKKLNQWLKLNFKRTSEWYDTTLKSQGGCCSLCSSRPECRRFQVDHDHSCCPTSKMYRRTCGKCVRGLLCEGCNTRLGTFELFIKEALIVPKLGKEDSWTARALSYLASYEKAKSATV